MALLSVVGLHPLHPMLSTFPLKLLYIPGCAYVLTGLMLSC